MVWASADTLRQMRNGTYEPWVCPNQLYVFKPERSNLAGIPGGLLVLEFKGRYNLELLAAEYGRMPGVEMALPNGIGPSPGIVAPGAGPNSYKLICATREGQDLSHYVFAEVIAYGGKLAYFTVGADGVVNAAGSYEGTELAGGPAWVKQYVNRDTCNMPVGRP